MGWMVSNRIMSVLAVALKDGIKCSGAIVFVVVMLVGCDDGRAQVSSPSYATKYFLDEPPVNFTFPAKARDRIIAKVKFIKGRIVYLPNRDQGGLPVPSQYKDPFMALVEVVESVSGQITNGEQLELYFGRPDGGLKYIYPIGSRQRGQSYFVASYIDEDGARRLMGFPADQDEYDRWYSVRRELDREKMRSGAHGN
jgi:hypothetical protein